jgi:ABC-2 type transport system permease protein
MRPQISAELLKIRTTRSLYVALAVVLALVLALPVAAASLAGHAGARELQPADLANVLRGPVRLAGGAVLLVGLLASAGEFRHHTVLTSRLAQPRPGRILLAKLAAMGALGLAVGVAMVVVSLAEAAVVFGSQGIAFEPMSHRVPELAVVVPLVLVVHALLGVAIGSLLRSTAAAVGATMGWAFVVEGVLPVVTRHPGIVHWLPAGLVNDVMRGHSTSGQLAAPAAAALLLSYVAALVAATVTLDRRREI